MPLTVALGEDIHPDIFSAGVFAFRGGLLGVAALNDGSAADDFNVHGAEVEGGDSGGAGGHVADIIFLRFFGAIWADADPVVSEDLAELVSIFGFDGVSPVVFQLLDGIRDAWARGFCGRGGCFLCLGVNESCGGAYQQKCYCEFLHFLSPI